MRTNANIAFQCAYHVVWCPKYRRKVIGGCMEVRLKEIIGEVITEKGAWLIELETRPDHVHSRTQIVKVPAAFTSQRCSACGHVDPKSRESQAVFRVPTVSHLPSTRM